MSNRNSTISRAPIVAMNRGISTHKLDSKDTASALFDEVIADRKTKDSPELGIGTDVILVSANDDSKPATMTRTRRKFTVGSKRKRFPDPLVASPVSVPLISISANLEKSPKSGENSSDPFNFSDDEFLANERVQHKSPRKSISAVILKSDKSAPCTRSSFIRPTTEYQSKTVKSLDPVIEPFSSKLNFKLTNSAENISDKSLFTGPSLVDSDDEVELGFDSHLKECPVIGPGLDGFTAISNPPTPVKGPALGSGERTCNLEVFSSPPRLGKTESTDSQSSISASIQSVSLYSPQKLVDKSVSLHSVDSCVSPQHLGKTVGGDKNADKEGLTFHSYATLPSDNSTMNKERKGCVYPAGSDAELPMESDDQSLISPARQKMKMDNVGPELNDNHVFVKPYSRRGGGITRVTFRPHDSNVFDIEVGRQEDVRTSPASSGAIAASSLNGGSSYIRTNKIDSRAMVTFESVRNIAPETAIQSTSAKPRAPRFFKNHKMLNAIRNTTIAATTSASATESLKKISADVKSNKCLEQACPIAGCSDKNDSTFDFTMDSSEDETPGAGSAGPSVSRIGESQESVVTSGGGNSGKKIFSSGKNKSKRPIYKHSWQLDGGGSDSQELASTSTAIPSAFQRSMSATCLRKNAVNGPTIEGQKRMLTARSVSLIKTEKPTDNRFGDEGETISQLKVSRKAKSLFTVIRNVKQAHQCHEWGEVQEFNDEIIYILDSLSFSNPINVRRLSALRLASQCLNPPFRAHIRINQIVPKIFRAVSDAAKDSVLGLITATILYILSRDRQGVSLDQRIVRLIVSLMQSSSSLDDQLAAAGLEERAEYKETLGKMWILLCDWKRKVFESNAVGSTFQFDVKLENLSASYLATESLVFLCVQTPMEWFKTDMRNLGGLDYIANKFILVCEEIEMNSHLPEFESLVEDDLRLVQRYLRIIENCTFMFKPNQDYLISFADHAVLLGCAKLLIYCQEMIGTLWQFSVDHSSLPSTSTVYSPPVAVASSPNPAMAPSPPLSPNFSSAASDSSSLCDTGLTRALFGCLTSNFKAIINLSHDNVLGCSTLGKNDDFVLSLLNFILKGHKFAPKHVQFDLLLLALGALINLVETCNANRLLLLTLTTDYAADAAAPAEDLLGIQALARLYVTHERQVDALEVSLDLEQVVGQVDSSNSTAMPTSTLRNGRDLRVGEEGDGDAIPGPSLAGLGDSNDDVGISPTKGYSLTSGEPTPQQIRKMVCGALKTAGQHMEDSIVCAYCALVIGCVLRQNEDKAHLIRKEFKSDNFEMMVAMLNKFKDFMERTNSFNSSSARSIDKVIETLESLD